MNKELGRESNPARRRLLELLFERVVPLMVMIYPSEVFVGSDDCENETCDHLSSGEGIGVHCVRRVWNVLDALTRGRNQNLEVSE